jgi:hypothetical protein
MSRLLLPGRAKRALAGIAGIVLLCVAGSALPAAAAATGATLSLSSPSPSSQAGVELTAQVASSTAAPMPEVTVNFYVHLQEFSGAPELLIGSASTNAAGVASITYQPTWAGTQRFVASAVDSSGSALAASSLSVQALRTDPFAGPVESLRPDGLIGRWVVVALLSLLIGVWITLLALVVRVQQGPVRTAE